MTHRRFLVALTLVLSVLIGGAIGGLSQLNAVTVDDPRPSVPPSTPEPTPTPSPEPAPEPTPSPTAAPPPSPRPEVWLYTVAAGESISSIAIRYGTTTEELLELNPEYRANENLVEAGAPLIVPCTLVAESEGQC